MESAATENAFQAGPDVCLNECPHQMTMSLTTEALKDQNEVHNQNSVLQCKIHP